MMIRRKRTSHDNDDDSDNDCQCKEQSNCSQEKSYYLIRNRWRYGRSLLLGKRIVPRIPMLSRTFLSSSSLPIIIPNVVIVSVAIVVAIVLLLWLAIIVITIVMACFISKSENNNASNTIISLWNDKLASPRILGHDIDVDTKLMDSKILRGHTNKKKEFHPIDKLGCKMIPVKDELLEPFLLFSGEAKRFQKICNDGDGDSNSNSNSNSSDHVPLMKTVEVVIAYCQEDLNWIYKDVIDVISPPRAVDNHHHHYHHNHGIKIRLTIMSKCGKESLLPDFVAQDSRIDKMSLVVLPNVGGCDYAYAHFINRYRSYNNMQNTTSTTSTSTTTTSSTATPYEYQNTVILFIKGSKRSPENFHFPHHERYNRVDEMLDLAFSGEFGCGLKTTCDVSPYHDTDTLNRFTIKAYSRISDIVQQNNLLSGSGTKHVQEEGMNALGYKNLGDFHRRALNWTFPNPQLTLVCYGGTFAIPAERIISVSSRDQGSAGSRMLETLEKALSRNSSAKVAVEEHFAERTWAGIFAEPLSLEQTNVVKSYQTSIVKRRFSIFGPLQSNHFIRRRNNSGDEGEGGGKCVLEE